jgi:hypothetical protein
MRMDEWQLREAVGSLAGYPAVLVAAALDEDVDRVVSARVGLEVDVQTGRARDHDRRPTRRQEVGG